MMPGVFTGIVEGIGIIQRVGAEASGGRTLVVESPFEPDAFGLGDSIATSGVCLTVTARDGRRFSVDVGPETLQRTTLGALSVGSRVNLERSVTLSTRLGGHLVQGHVDAVGRIARISRRENAWDLEIEAPEEVLALTVPRGSIAIDGTSLTVTKREGGKFGVMIIPHTYQATTIGERRVGDSVNLEADLIARYVAGLLDARGLGAAPGLTEARMLELGYGDRR